MLRLGVIFRQLDVDPPYIAEPVMPATTMVAQTIDRFIRATSVLMRKPMPTSRAIETTSSGDGPAGGADVSTIFAPVTLSGGSWSVAGASLALVLVSWLIVLLAENCRIPFDDPNTHLELTMIHEAMILEYSGRYLALMEWGASIKQLVLMSLLVNVFFPVGIATNSSTAALVLGTLVYLAKVLVLSGAVVIVETTNAKLRLFRVPDLLSVAFVLAALALFFTFIAVLCFDSGSWPFIFLTVSGLLANAEVTAILLLSRNAPVDVPTVFHLKPAHLES